MQSFVPFTFRFPTTHRTFVSGPFSCLFRHNCTSLLRELRSELCSYLFLTHQQAPVLKFGASWSVELSLCACCSICLNLGVDSDTLVSNKNLDRVATGEDLDQYIFTLLIPVNFGSAVLRQISRSIYFPPHSHPTHVTPVNFGSVNFAKKNHPSVLEEKFACLCFAHNGPLIYVILQQRVNATLMPGN